MGWSLHHPHGLIYHAPQYCYRGYTLFANLRGYDANLIDMEGAFATGGTGPVVSTTPICCLTATFYS